MPNVTSPDRPPAYRRHKATGQSLVTIGGRDIYLGKHGTAASREAYRRHVGEWMQAGGQLPAPKNAATVTEIIVAYLTYADGYYRKDDKVTDEVRMLKAALKIVRHLYGRTPAAEFGPLALQSVREAMIGKDWCRKHVNKQVDRVKRCFRWATTQQMIPGGVYEALRCVAGLKTRRRAHSAIRAQEDMPPAHEISCASDDAPGTWSCRVPHND
jgi:hypothetical protein